MSENQRGMPKQSVEKTIRPPGHEHGESKVEWILAITGLLWAILGLGVALIAIIELRPAIPLLLSRIDTLSIGTSLTKISISLKELTEASGKSDHAPLTESELKPLESRARILISQIRGRNILWMDSNFPEANQRERNALSGLGFSIETVKSTADAMSAMNRQGYDLIITNMQQGDEEYAGRHLMDEMCHSRIHIPGVIYSRRFNPEDGVPLNAVGAARNRAQLFQLIFDTAELGFPKTRCLPAWCNAADTSSVCQLSPNRAYGRSARSEETRNR